PHTSGQAREDSPGSHSPTPPPPLHKKARVRSVLSEKESASIGMGADDHNPPQQDRGEHGSASQNSPAPPSTRSSSPDVEILVQEEVDHLELEKMQKGWHTSVYALFKPDPKIIYDKSGRKSHVFACTAKGCRTKVTRYLDTKDVQSTSNMRKHVRKCWGEDVLEATDSAKNKNIARKDVIEKYKKNGSITVAFKRKGNGNITYSHRQHTKTQTRTKIVHWVTESYRLFAIVKDRGFNCLMKTGRPGYYLPHPTTVSRNVKTVFLRARKWIGRMLQEYNGHLSFATDAWTSPNHCPYIVVTVHFFMKSKPISLLLDIVEVAESHSGLVLATAFAKILEDFNGLNQKKAYKK
ncbi:hypothetical protein H0H92_007188, partial [Tricholoma furcatifolium]